MNVGGDLLHPVISGLLFFMVQVRKKAKRSPSIPITGTR